MARTVDLQIRKMPALLRDRLRTRARGKGKSMSRYVIDVLSDDLERPTIDEWLAELRQLPRIPRPKGVTGATLVREARAEADREIADMADRLTARRSKRS